MTTAYVGAGSNVGDRASFVRRAVQALRETKGVEVTAVSNLYETSPVGGPPQRSFVNVVAAIETSLDPRALLAATQTIEARLGREPSDIRWGPRTVDLDILLFGDLKMSEPDLEIPHPRMRERRFVLVPLLEIAPDVTDPWGARLDTYLEDAQGEVEVLEPF